MYSQQKFLLFEQKRHTKLYLQQLAMFQLLCLITLTLLLTPND